MDNLDVQEKTHRLDCKRARGLQSLGIWPGSSERIELDSEESKLKKDGLWKGSIIVSTCEHCGEFKQVVLDIDVKK